MKNSFFKNHWLIIFVIFLPILLLIIIFLLKENWTKKTVHWHMPISYDLCWNTTNLKDSWDHWDFHFIDGRSHWHNDWLIHVEWVIDYENRIETLQTFFDSANIEFSENGIQKYNNTYKCNGSNKTWKLILEVNWEENNQYGNYILNDKDIIKIIFK